MKFSLQATIWAGIVFSIVCLAIAATGFNSLADITDPAQHADAQGFAWFWMFLAAVCAALSALAWWMVRGLGERIDS